MITDAFLSFVHGSLSALFGLLPPIPQGLDLSGMGNLMRAADWFLPMHEIRDLLPTLMLIYGGFLTWRVVRALLPGG